MEQCYWLEFFFQSFLRNFFLLSSLHQITETDDGETVYTEDAELV
jgi:hypothetical protein